MLSPDQHSELERMGTENVRSKLTTYGGGRGAAIGGFRCGDITRGDIEDWLAEKHSSERREQQSTLFWAKIAALTGIITVAIALYDALWKK